MHKGIIPANTGRIAHAEHIPEQYQDHPREYGENLLGVKYLLPEDGSSPRIRGESGPGTIINANNRIIPANTGRIQGQQGKLCDDRDHPREYGENDARLEAEAQEEGSSPRIRGELLAPAAIVPLRGIIPANTGRIRLSAAPRVRLQDHPREYGENAKRTTRGYRLGGSSPRIRGESVTKEVTPFRLGIIPANTGRI